MEEVRHVNRAAVARLFGRGGARGHTAASAVEPTHAPHKLSHNTGDDASKHAHRCVSSSTSAAAFVGPVPICDGRPAWVEPRSVPMQRHQHVDVCSSGAVNERTSAIAMRQRIRRHEQFIPSVDEPDQHTRGVRGESASNNVVARLRSASQHARAVERYEHTIPQRRAVDEYINITGAQGDARLNIPNAYTAEKLALRNGGRWCLDNQHHQQLLRGEPIMTRVMAGEFYNERTPPAKLPNNATKNFIEANRFNVRAASCHLVEARRCKSACVATRGGVPRRRC